MYAVTKLIDFVA